MNRSTRFTCLVLMIVSIGGCTSERVPENVILITLDTTRADHIGCYGSSGAHTPTLDSLAVQGILFENAATTYPMTLPSHASIHTGLQPTSHAVRDNAGYTLAARHPKLATILDQADYATAAFVSAFVISRETGLNHGFDVYDDHLYNERSGSRTTAAATRWIEEQDPARPFFLWVHYFDPHTPWEPREPYASMDLPTDYDREIASMDGSIADLLRTLRNRDVLDNAVILVVADHGEGLGDHGEHEHGLFLYDEVVRVPMILSYPGCERATVSGQASTIDIAPTLLELVGLTSPTPMDGESLLGMIERGTPLSRRASYAETYVPELNYHYSATQALRTPNWKYIHAPMPELYDLDSDPGETTNLFTAQPDTAQLFQDRMERFLASAPRPSTESTTAVTEEALERLHSLGYLSGGEVTPGAADLPDPKEMVPVLEDFAAGKLAASEGRSEDAIGLLSHVLEQNPDNLIARLVTGRCLLRLDRPEEAAEMLAYAHALVPENATVAKYLGTALRRSGRPADAYEIYRLAANDETQHWLGVIGMAGCLMDQSEFEEALEFLTEQAGSAEQANPARSIALRLQNYLEIRSESESNPNDVTRLRKATFEMDLGLLDRAAETLQFSPGEDPRVVGLRHRQLGALADLRDDPQEALRQFELALQSIPGDGTTLRRVALLYLDAGLYAKSVQAGMLAFRSGENDPIVLYNVACALSLAGERERAIRLLEGAVALGYTDALKIEEDPDLAPIRTDPKFLELLGRIRSGEPIELEGLPERETTKESERLGSD